MSKKKAEEWAKHWIESMARTAGAEIRTETEPDAPAAKFTDCVGENNEIADDGRFTLRYDVHAYLARNRQTEGIRAIRDTLKAKGFEIQGYRSDPTMNPVNLVDAKHPNDHQFVSVEDLNDELILLTVSTPCLLPPGAKQQQF
ncbi:hypothetical protein [Streptomyces sp. NRRL F-5135]|uniref:hypothetical protein n=1 Tax=Streptomyces sp. NRRL F-5135 TaxID=1463858 RepID=UPI000B295EF1|nr:hypothetical protein [Streptomyces sp. NRRL F-5135]